MAIYDRKLIIKNEENNTKHSFIFIVHGTQARGHMNSMYLSALLATIISAAF